MSSKDKGNHPVPITFGFSNIGPVKSAELKLGDLTIIGGQNNTGKSYLVYTLYGFLKIWDRLPSIIHTKLRKNISKDLNFDFTNISASLLSGGKASIKITSELLNRQRNKLLNQICKDFSRRGIHQVFSTKPDDFEKSSISVRCLDEVSETKDFTHHANSITLNEIDGKSGSLRIELKENLINFTLKTNNRAELEDDLENTISYSYLQLMLGNILPTPFILSAERFGISLFYRELDFTKNQLVDLLQKIGDQKNNENYSPFLFIDRTTSRYALPIKDNIDYTRNIADHKKDKSDLYSSKVFGDIEAMMAGNYKIVDDEIRFMSKPRDGEKRFNIPLHLASSSVRGLSDLYFYLRHIANNNQLLIIDEPESHLDTNNQVQLARLLARLVNSGVKVLITTHSDYLIKEINNLIMLDHDFEGKDKVRRKLKYKKEDSLNKNCVSAYIATTKGLTSCAVDKYGIEMPVFDETIDRINTVSNELASRI